MDGWEVMRYGRAENRWSGGRYMVMLCLLGSLIVDEDEDVDGFPDTGIRGIYVRT